MLGTLASGTLALNAIGTATTASLRYVVSGNFTVANGATLSVAANVSVLIQPGVTLADNGTLTFASGDALTISNNRAATQIVVGSGGLLMASGTTFTNIGSLLQRPYRSQQRRPPPGQHLRIRSQPTVPGCRLHPQQRRPRRQRLTPAREPASHRSKVHVGHPQQQPAFPGHRHFVRDSLASGTLALNAIGTATTASLRYVVSGNFTVANGATLSVAANVSVLIQPGVTLADNGTLTFASGDALTISNNGAATQIVVGSGGLLMASGTTFTNIGSFFNGHIEVVSGGHLQASNCEFALNQLYLDAGCILNSGDLVGNGFDLPVFLPATDVQYLSGTGSNNLRFQDIDILLGTLASGTLALNAIGTATTASLRYVVSGNFTVANGATLSVAANVSVLIQPGVTLADNGTLTFASGDALTISNNGAATQIVVGSGGLLMASGTTFTNIGSFFNGHVEVASGGQLQATGCTIALNQLYLDNGSTDTIHSTILDTQLDINSHATISITGNDFSNGTVAAAGDPNATINLTNNYWGTTNTTQIAAKITSTGPTVITQPFLALAPATILVITAPATATAGNALSITVTAQNPSHSTVTNFTGTVHFSSTDAQAVLPADATLTNGVGIFSATLKTAGSQTLTVTDTGSSGLTVTSSAITISPTAASRFAAIGIPATIAAGSPIAMTLFAQDQYGNTATSYAGTVKLSTTDKAASLPAPSTLTAGKGIFSVVLRTTGCQTLTANDMLTSAIALISNPITVVPPKVSIVLDAASDSGVSNNDGLTNVTNPAFDVQVNEAGTIQMDFTGKGTVTATLAVTSAGTYQLTAPVLPNGTYSAIVSFVSAVGIIQASTTYTIDTAGPYVVSMNPNGLVGTAVNQVTITFDKPINLGTFTPLAITLSGPGGVVVVNQPTLVSGTTYAIGFANLTALGSYTLTVAPSVADLAGNKMDQNRNGINGEVGDSFSGAFSISLPDLIVAPGSIIPPPTAITGTTVPISFAITNQGTEPTYSVWQDVVILSQDPNLASKYDGIDDAVLFTNTVVQAFPNVSFLNPGQTYTQNVNVALPINAQVNAQDTWYVYVVPDSTGSHYVPHMAEASRTDKIARSAAFTVTLSPLPNLAVTKVIAPAISFSGQSLTVGWTVANSGTFVTSVADWTDAVYMSAINSLDSTATLLGTFPHSGILTPGAAYSNTQEVTLPLTMPGSPTLLLSGSFYFLVKTDISGAVFEIGATNNVGATNTAKTIDPASTPDLTVSTVTPPPSSLAAHDVSFSYTVVNQGLGGTPSSVWTDAYYLSPTATFNSSTAISLGQQQILGGLDAEADYSKTINVTLPSNLSGKFFILVDTDSGGANFELTADQPHKWGASAAFQVNNSPPDLVVFFCSVLPPRRWRAQRYW